MSPDERGIIRMSWAQLAWGIMTLAAVLAGWYDTRAQLSQIKAELGIRVQQAELEHVRIWKAIDNAEAASLMRYQAPQREEKRR